TDKNPFPMPFLLTPEQAAAATWRGLQRSGFEVTYPKRLSWGLKLLAALPYGVYGVLARRMLSKPR
ncbi:MAG: oxidoreductase, partial [Proteobacteria bacterium]|nr:oxidoreductase [Pseudomonadota bacterium]